MPFKSRAQARKFFAMARRGEISKETLNEWVEATPNIKKLPERVGHKKKAFVLSFFNKIACSLFLGGTREKMAYGTDGANLPEEALKAQGSANAQDYVQGSTLREKAETGQAKGRATSTGVANEKKEFASHKRHLHRTSRE